MSTFPSETEVIRAPGLIDKTSEHPLGMLLLGEVTAVQWLPSRLLLYFADGRVTKVTYNEEDGHFVAGDHQVPMC